MGLVFVTGTAQEVWGEVLGGRIEQLLFSKLGIRLTGSGEAFSSPEMGLSTIDALAERVASHAGAEPIVRFLTIPALAILETTPREVSIEVSIGGGRSMTLAVIGLESLAEAMHLVSLTAPFYPFDDTKAVMAQRQEVMEYAEPADPRALLNNPVPEPPADIQAWAFLLMTLGEAKKRNLPLWTFK